MTAPARKPEPGTEVARKLPSDPMPYDLNPVPLTNTEKPYALKSPIAQILESDAAKAVIVPLIPKGVDWQEVVIEVYRAYTVNNDIGKCTPQSIAMAVGTAVQTGLRIGKTIHLVPVNTKVSKKGEPDRYEQRLQAWTDYKGDIELVVRSGAARHVDAAVVYRGDAFEYELGDTPFVKHRPEIDATKRGPMIAAYSIAYLNGFGTLKKITVMPLADIEKVRKGSKQWSPEKVPQCPDWYAMKTAIHRNCKTLPKNEKLARVIALFDRQEAADRGDEAFDELPIGLDPSRQIAAPSAESFADPSSVSSEARSQIQPVSESATHGEAGTAADDDEGDLWTPPSEQQGAQQPRKRYAVENVTLPFGERTVGRPIWMVSTVDLESAYKFARKTRRYAAFTEAAESVLELRRVGDISEPTPEDLALPTPRIEPEAGK